MSLTMRRLDDWSVESVDEGLHFRLDAAAHELVGVVDDEAQLGRILGVDAARILRGNDDGGIDFAGADVFFGLALVSVFDGSEGGDVDGDGVERFADLDGLRAVIVVDYGNVGAADFAAERVAKDDELHERQHHRHDHENGRAEELAHFALDNGEHSVHGCAPGLGGIMKTALTCSSRSWRPV